MTGNLMKEKGYKLLADHYKSLWKRTYFRASNVKQYTKEVADKDKFIESLADSEKWDSTGIFDKRDQKEVALLEYLLDDESPVKY